MVSHAPRLDPEHFLVMLHQLHRSKFLSGFTSWLLACSEACTQTHRREYVGSLVCLRRCWQRSLILSAVEWLSYCGLVAAAALGQFLPLAMADWSSRLLPVGVSCAAVAAGSPCLRARDIQCERGTKMIFYVLHCFLELHSPCLPVAYINPPLGASASMLFL